MTERNANAAVNGCFALVLVLVMVVLLAIVLSKEEPARIEGLEKAHAEGQEAAKDGFDHTVCPFSQTWCQEGRREQWLRGWMEAAKERRTGP